MFPYKQYSEEELVDRRRVISELIETPFFSTYFSQIFTQMQEEQVVACVDDEAYVEVVMNRLETLRNHLCGDALSILVEQLLMSDFSVEDIESLKTELNKSIFIKWVIFQTSLRVHMGDVLINNQSYVKKEVKKAWKGIKKKGIPLGEA